MGLVRLLNSKVWPSRRSTEGEAWRHYSGGGGERPEENLCLGTKYDSHTTHHHAAQLRTEPEAPRCERGFNGSPLSVCELKKKASCDPTTVFLWFLLTNHGLTTPFINSFVHLKIDRSS